MLLAFAVFGFFPASWPVLAVFIFLVGQGSYACFIGGYAPSVVNFPAKYRGITASACVAAFAASSMFFSLIYRYGFRVPLDDPKLAENVAYYLVVLAASGEREKFRRKSLFPSQFFFFCRICYSSHL